MNIHLIITNSYCIYRVIYSLICVLFNYSKHSLNTDPIPCHCHVHAMCYASLMSGMPVTIVLIYFKYILIHSLMMPVHHQVQHSSPNDSLYATLSSSVQLCRHAPPLIPLHIGVDGTFASLSLPILPAII
jgi:hypothetical protein